jgi:hypothetical protein
MVPSLICLVSCLTPWIVNPVGDAVNDWRFINHLGTYEKIEFFQPGGFGVGSGYVYRELTNFDQTTDLALQREKRFRLRHVVGRWYHFAVF